MVQRLMRQMGRGCGLAGGLLLLLAGCSDPPALTRLAADATILAFGDSLTYGTGATAEQSYPAVLAAVTGYRVVNSGVPGERTAAGRARLAEALAEHRPQLVILCEGGNDILRRVPQAETVANLRAMIAQVRAAGAEPLLVSVPEPGLFPGAAEFYRTLAEEEAVVLEGQAVTTVLRQRELRSDPIHPNAAGYRRLAELLLERLRESGAL